MKALALFAGLVMAGTAAAQGSAPFCVVTNGLTHCRFYDLASCRQNAVSLDGICVVNQTAAPSQQPLPQPRQQASVLDSMRRVQEQAELGRQAGMDQRERDARMQALQARGATSMRVTYSCVTADGSTYQTVDFPIVGCTVTAIDF